MKLVFMGTPEFAVPSLQALVEAGHEVTAVFTQPDKPKNRGMKLQPTPVKEYALTQNIPIYQPKTLRDGEAFQLLQELAPELIVVAAYGKILPVDILNLPRLGCVNVHSSLLPKYRGAAPINWAILNGESETGVTIMYMAEGLDTGDIIAQSATPITLDETASTLHDRLAEMGADLLTQVVASLENGTVTRTPQRDEQSSYAPMLSKELSHMDWTRSARQLHDQVRGLIPWPSAITEMDGVRCKVWRTTLTGETSKKAPGTIIQADKKGLKVACGDGMVLQIDELQPDGKKRMAATAFLMGHPIQTN
jgi:methionyl-tRNA formyltransferase